MASSFAEDLRVCKNYTLALLGFPWVWTAVDVFSLIVEQVLILTVIGVFIVCGVVDTKEAIVNDSATY